MPGWVDFFIVVAAVAIIIQMAILVAMYFQVRTALEKFALIATQLQGRIDPILVRTNRILEDSEDRIRSIMTDAAELTRVARGQAQKVDRVFTDAVERLRTMELIEEAGSTFKSKLWQPFNQASAILKGIKAGIDFIRGQKARPDGDVATQDEELFI